MTRALWMVLIGLAACKQPDAAPPPPPKPQPMPQPPREVELIAPGSEPRRVLRYHLTKGAVTDAVFAVDMDVTAGPRDLKVPTIELAMAIRVEDVLPDGTAVVRFTYTDVETKDRTDATVPVREVNDQAQVLAGAVMTGKISPVGKLTDVALVPSAKLGALADDMKELTGSVKQVAMPLPEQAVGVGAVWEVRKPVQQSGMQLVMSTRVALTSLEGDTLGFTLQSSVAGADQTVLHDGTSVQVSGLGGDGDGKGTIDLAKFAFAAVLNARFKATMRMLGETAPMNVAIATRVTPRS